MNKLVKKKGPASEEEMTLEQIEKFEDTIRVAEAFKRWPVIEPEWARELLALARWALTAKTALEGVNAECVVAPRPDPKWIAEKCAEAIASFPEEK